MRRIKKGDEVIVIAGKDKGRRGTVVNVLQNDKLLVENINIVKKHVKANPNAGVAGGIVEKEAPLNISNLKVICPKCNRPTRIGVKILEDKSKVRYCKHPDCGEII